jgi:protein-S-isoprenylcysteine O-methyltransferase Ste14
MRWLVLFVWMLWAIYYFIASGLFSAERITVGQAFRRQRGRFLIIFISLTGLINFGYLFIRALSSPYAPDSALLFILLSIGLLLFFSGISGMTYVRLRYLKNSWKPFVHVETDLALVTEGPYRFVRHPIYTFSLLIYVGMALVFQDAIGFITNGLLIAGYIALAIYEDVVLSRGVQAYGVYKTKTRARLVPWIF